jgi:hypothetical protein
MIVRRRPTVMISSTIGELARERQHIAATLADVGLADGWLFELHATAAGNSPESRYLNIASTCDLYVIIVAAQGSEATEAEYQAAYADNPRKVLPFFVGDDTAATKSLRDLIESRHVRVRLQQRADLAPAVIAAIVERVRTGEIVIPLLIEALDARLRRAEEVVRARLPLVFIPMLRSNPQSAPSGPGEDPFPATNLPSRAPQFVLEGIGGSGKTYSGLATLRHASSKGKLPVVVQASPNVLCIQDLITGAFESVRFFPGDELLQQLARDGRLAVMVDGIDALASSDRRIFLQDLEEFARRFPRSVIICCLRRALPDELMSAARFTIEPLSDGQIADMFGSVNAPQIAAFPPQVADLARWPFWSWALIEVGSSAPTGLVLLQRLLEHRIRTSGPYAPIETEMLLDAAATLAFHAWPQPWTRAQDALTTLGTWGVRTSVRSKFCVPPAEGVIQRLSSAGLVQLAPSVEFAHPLFATYLAASHAATAGPITEPMAADPEFAIFVAALLDEDRVTEKLEHLLRHGPVGQARYLRLVHASPRKPQQDDPVLFGAFLKTLSGSAATCVVTEDWTAWRPADEPRAASADAVAEWMADGEITFLQGNAFMERSPLDVATIESLARFKSHVIRQRPDEDSFDWLADPEVKRLRKLPRSDLDDLILQAALDWRREWREQAAALGISTLPETAIADGDPDVTVYECWPDPRLRIDWGGTARVTWVLSAADVPAWNYQPLSRLLEPGRSARIYAELIERAERALGCAFGSQAWSRPEHVAAWAW